MPQYLIQITHTILVEAHNRPTAELIAKNATSTNKANPEQGLLQVKPVSKLILQEVV
jgi:mannose-1-phosphate guanylyltransferase